MEHQRDIHNNSWESRKPDSNVVSQKQRIKSTLSLLDGLIKDGDRVFDLGCGDGTVGANIKKKHNITIEGCDISEVALDRARNEYQTVYQLNIDDENIPVESNRYDIVICTDVLEHTLSPINNLKKIQRMLKYDGIAVISVPNYGFIRYRINSIMGDIPSIVSDERHYNTFTQSYLQDLLTESGLEIQTTCGVSDTQKLAKLASTFPQIFAKTIIVTATKTGKEGTADDLYINKKDSQ